MGKEELAPASAKRAEMVLALWENEGGGRICLL